HASTLKSPSYTKSVSWQHYLKMMNNNITTLMASTPLTSQIN
ncbi:transposase, partial [Shigella flexneri]